MTDRLRLMCVLAHPDDESLGTGGTLARYAAEGVETYLVTATRGEHGWAGPPEENPGPLALGKLREAELHAAAQTLGIRRVDFLDYIDGFLDQADPAEVIGKIVGHLRRIRPQVVITFGPDGAYGHPDHIAICQFTTAAIVCAADAAYQPTAGTPHSVSKLYYMAVDEHLGQLYESIFGELIMKIDGVERRGVAWPEWAITTRIDATAFWPTVWRAVACHRSQIPNYGLLEHLPAEQHSLLWGDQAYYRAFSLVNGGRSIETDLFEGLH